MLNYAYERELVEMRCYNANMQDLIARNIGDDMCAMALRHQQNQLKCRVEKLDFVFRFV